MIFAIIFRNVLIDKNIIMEMKNKQIAVTTNNNSNKYSKLVLSLLFDFIGIITYVVPALGELADVVWAPLSGLLLYSMYKGNVGKIAGIFGTLEELIPFTDIIPTFTITWFYVYVIKKEEV